MKIEDLESAWAAQPAPAVDVEKLRRSLKTEISRRKRLLVYVGISAFIGLVAMQAIFVAGMRAPHTESAWVAAGRLMLHQTLSLALLFEVVRAYLRHRRLASGRAASVREVTNLSLVAVESEIMDYRIGKWVIVVMGLQSLLSVYLNKLSLHFTWTDFGGRVLIIFALFGMIALLGWRHYRRVLVPRRQELKERLRQLEGEA